EEDGSDKKRREDTYEEGSHRSSARARSSVHATSVGPSTKPVKLAKSPRPRSLPQRRSDRSMEVFKRRLVPSVHHLGSDPRLEVALDTLADGEILLDHAIGEGISATSRRGSLPR